MLGSGSAPQEEVWGHKAAGLHFMLAAGLPCPAALVAATADGIAPVVERAAEWEWPDPPLLLAVRASPATALPGKLPTLLDVGWHDRVHAWLSNWAGEAAAWQVALRYFSQAVPWLMISDPGEAAGLAAHLGNQNAELQGATPAQLQQRVAQVRQTLTVDEGPDPMGTWREQLPLALRAVLRSTDMVDMMVVAAVVQPMVRAEKGGAGVALSRHPHKGNPGPVGEFVAGQGGDALMAGRLTPATLTGTSRNGPTLEQVSPAAVQALGMHVRTLELFRGHPVEVEFALEEGALALLQVRQASLTPAAMLVAALSLAQEGALPGRAAAALLSPEAVAQLVVTRVLAGEGTVLGHGVPASSGAAVGVAAFSSDAAVRLRGEGKCPVLVVRDVTPDDVEGLKASVAVVTARGGTTSHAAVMSRTMGLPCVVHVQDLLRVDAQMGANMRSGARLVESELVTVDGSVGLFCLGRLPLVAGPGHPALGRWVALARLHTRMGVCVLPGSQGPTQVEATLPLPAGWVTSAEEPPLPQHMLPVAQVAGLAVPGSLAAVWRNWLDEHAPYVPLGTLGMPAPGGNPAFVVVEDPTGVVVPQDVELCVVVDPRHVPCAQQVSAWADAGVTRLGCPPGTAAAWLAAALRSETGVSKIDRSA